MPGMNLGHKILPCSDISTSKRTISCYAGQMACRYPPIGSEKKGDLRGFFRTPHTSRIINGTATKVPSELPRLVKTTTSRIRVTLFRQKPLMERMSV